MRTEGKPSMFVTMTSDPNWKGVTIPTTSDGEEDHHHHMQATSKTAAERTYASNVSAAAVAANIPTLHSNQKDVYDGMLAAMANPLGTQVSVSQLLNTFDSC